jgi:glycosyltransferase involved in cell wall biosynthesis
MKVALVASSYLPCRGRLERRVDQLAHGLARRGAQVEILTQAPVLSSVRSGGRVTVRRFTTLVEPVRFAVSPKLRERIREDSRRFDVIDLHTREPQLIMALARLRLPGLVFTPAAPAEVFLAWPYTRASRLLVRAAKQIVCHSEVERDRFCQAVPGAAPRTRVVRNGVDDVALSSADPIPTEKTVVLAVDRLGRSTGVARAIAAMPSLDAAFDLVVVGDGPWRRRLTAYAADLHVSERVQFVGSVTDAVLYRWLRTAKVVVAMSGEGGSGSQVTEARAAGAAVVASDVAVHRDAAARPGGPVIFVSPQGSPLDVADAVDEAARLAVLPTAEVLLSPAPSWESVVDSTLKIYRSVLGDGSLPSRGEAESAWPGSRLTGGVNA